MRDKGENQGQEETSRQPFQFQTEGGGGGPQKGGNVAAAFSSFPPLGGRVRLEVEEDEEKFSQKGGNAFRGAPDQRYHRPPPTRISLILPILYCAPNSVAEMSRAESAEGARGHGVVRAWFPTLGVRWVGRLNGTLDLVLLSRSRS